MSEKIHLPHHRAVSRWKAEKVIKWLKKMHLEDCILAFEARHIDGPKLLELNEQKLFTYQDLKIKHRKQIAKCVQECKSQATNAKRIAKTLKHNQGSHSDVIESNGTCDSGDDSNDWGSDFEDESEDEANEEKSPLEVNNNTIIQPLPGLLEKNSRCSPPLTSVASEEKCIPKPPDVPVISKAVNGTSVYKNFTNTIPRPPLKRPPSQPPPPPIAQVPSHVEIQEDYEVPIFSTSSNIKESFGFVESIFQASKSCEQSGIETYEIVQPPEENYEIVDAPHSSMTEKPLLPPRHLKSLGSTSPPPLPQKPHKLKENSGTDGIKTFSRPKLPEADCMPPPSLPTNMGFISSLMGRRPSTTPSSSPKSQHMSKDPSSSLVTSPISAKVMSNGSLSSSSSPDKDGSMLSLDGKKMQPLPPLPPRGAFPISDDTAQNMATRPLPPVPVLTEEKPAPNKLQQDVLLYPWFHEIEREDAEAAVRKLNEAGSFVVRPSKRAGKENPYSLTVLHGEKLFHLNIRERVDNTFALGKEKIKEKTFTTVSELIDYHLSEPILLKNRGEAVGKTILRKYPEKT